MPIKKIEISNIGKCKGIKISFRYFYGRHFRRENPRFFYFLREFIFAGKALYPIPPQGPLSGLTPLNFYPDRFW